MLIKLNTTISLSLIVSATRTTSIRTTMKLITCLLVLGISCSYGFIGKIPNTTSTNQWQQNRTQPVGWLPPYSGGDPGFIKPPPLRPGQPPVHHPSQPPLHHPSNPPVYNPSQPPVYHPSQPPLSHPSQPPLHHPSNPPVYNPSQPPLHHPSNPPVYNPTVSPSYPGQAFPSAPRPTITTSKPVYVPRNPNSDNLKLTYDVPAGNNQGHGTGVNYQAQRFR